MNPNQKRIKKMQEDLEKLRIKENKRIKEEFEKILEDTELYRVLNSKNLPDFKQVILNFIASEKMKEQSI